MAWEEKTFNRSKYHRSKGGLLINRTRMYVVQPGVVYRAFTLMVHVVAPYCAPRASCNEASNIPQSCFGPQARFTKKMPALGAAFLLNFYLKSALWDARLRDTPGTASFRLINPPCNNPPCCWKRHTQIWCGELGHVGFGAIGWGLQKHWLAQHQKGFAQQNFSMSPPGPIDPKST